MVGAAQYLDEEIDWVLSAVVGKKKQSYIQTHFKDKFGRSLNHNQIRYIKNKYGKDPRFKYEFLSSLLLRNIPPYLPFIRGDICMVKANATLLVIYSSPLVNTRAPRIVTSPKLGVPSEQEDEGEPGNGVDFGSFSEAGPSTYVGERQSELKDEAMAVIQTKRKRRADDPGDVRERYVLFNNSRYFDLKSIISNLGISRNPRLIKKITGPQRPELQPDQAATPELASRAVEYETPPQQWNTANLQLSASHVHSVSPPNAPPTASLADNYHDPLHAGVHDGTQQSNPLQFHSTSTGIGWTPSVSLSTWGIVNSPVFTSVSSSATPSALVHPPTTMDHLYHPAAQNHMLLQTPATTQYQLQMPPSHLAALSVSQLSPPMPGVALSPYRCHQEQQHDQLLQSEQELHSHIKASSTPVFPNLVISEMEGHPCLDHDLSRTAYQLVPSFQVMPIQPAFYEHAAELSTLAAGDVREHH